MQPSDTLPRMENLKLLLMLIVVAPALHAQTGQSCTKLSSTSSKATLTATLVDSGSFTPAGGKTLPSLPPFCRVTAALHPTPDSNIGVEIWLPATGWNGKYLAAGSGGWGGSIAYDALARGLRKGYAVSATDDGHTGPSADFIPGHPEKFIDFGYRADHEMAVTSRALIQNFYNRAPRYSYWEGCSGGGREGLIQAAHYPEEFDGIIAGDPANIRRNAWALWLANETFKDPASVIPPAKYALVHQTVLDACDASDGLKDGLISDPESCHPNLKPLACKAGDAADCLTPKQLHSAEILLTTATGKSGTIYFPRVEPGTELRWSRLAGGPEPAELFYDQFRYVVYQNPHWDWRTFDLDHDAEKANAIDKDVDEMDPHLAAFARHGKLLIYHGWADQQVAPGSSVEFYKATIADSGPATANWVRLYMVPGMGHCSGGEGPDTFDKLSVLEAWVEQNKPPQAVQAAHQTDGKVDRTRPLCPYPQIARYNGSGSIDEAANFTCKSR
jgi:feruloyl esterase